MTKSFQSDSKDAIINGRRRGEIEMITRKQYKNLKPGDVVLCRCSASSGCSSVVVLLQTSEHVGRGWWECKEIKKIDWSKNKKCGARCRTFRIAHRSDVITLLGT
jgi:predicted RNA-binding protein YlxR (DUF448 family)